MKNKIIHLIDLYIAQAQSMTDEAFGQKPVEDKWSQAELFSHVVFANDSGLKAMHHCAAGKGELNQKITKWGVVILFIGLFPPLKLKVPKSVEEKTEQLNRAKAIERMQAFKAEIMASSPDITQNKTHRMRHPRLGYLTAAQWLRFIEIHTRHHWKQSQRHKAMLSN